MNSARISKKLVDKSYNEYNSCPVYCLIHIFIYLFICLLFFIIFLIYKNNLIALSLQSTSIKTIS